MKDEIKEILDKLRSDDYYKKEYQKSVYYERDLKKLEDCITNLQEENKKISNQHLVTINKLIEVQDRIDKVIEYIKNDLVLTDGFTIYEDGAKDLLNILEGSDKE